MISNYTLQIWMSNFLFVLGLVIIAVGLWMILLPQQFLKIGTVLSKWVSTEGYFNSLDKPRYQEPAIYKHHRIIGGLIVLGGVYTLVMFLRVDLDTLEAGLSSLGNTFWMDWIYMAVYYLLISGNLIAIVIGIIVFIRPSLLKHIEAKMNKWIVSGEGLKRLDERHEVPANVLPGKPRLFGLIVVLGGLYIIFSTGGLIL
jgi:hypothetical protein